MNKSEFKIFIFMILVCVVTTLLVNLVCEKFIEEKHKDDVEKLSLIRAHNEDENEWVKKLPWILR